MSNEVAFIISADSAQGEAAVKRMAEAFEGMGDKAKKTGGMLDDLASSAGKMGLALSAGVTSIP